MPLRPLLGLHRRLPLPALRALLSPGHRLGHRPWPFPGPRPAPRAKHKLARGYLPVETHSLHWIADPGFRAAVDRYLQAERRAVGEEIEVLTAYGPFRRCMAEP